MVLAILIFGFSAVRLGSLIQAKVLGDNDNKDKSNRGRHTGQQADDEDGEGATPTVTATPTYGIQFVLTATPTMTPTATLPPTETPTQTPTPTASPTPVFSETSTTTQITSSGFTEQGKQQGTIQTVENIIRKVVKPVAKKVVEKIAEENVTKEEVKVVPTKTTSEILAILDSISAEKAEEGKMTRLRYKELGDQIAVVAETSEGKQLGLSVDEAMTLQRKLLSEARFRIARGTAGGYVFSTGAVKAKTDLSVLVDLRNNLLTVETSIGIKPVPVSADTAVAVARGIKMIRGLNEKFGEGAVRLKERADLRLVYEVNGVSNWKLLGLFPFSRTQRVEVSALSGKIIPIERELNQLLVDLVSRRVD